jgi:hypothetical protein
MAKILVLAVNRRNPTPERIVSERAYRAARDPRDRTEAIRMIVIAGGRSIGAATTAAPTGSTARFQSASDPSRG